MDIHNATPLSPYSSFSHRSRVAFGAVSDWSPESTAAWVKARDLGYAQATLTDALKAYADAKLYVGRVNRECAKSYHARPAAWRRKLLRTDAFVSLNKARGRLIRARKALAALADA